ncbi:MAG: redoxin family protein [Verrucomicrobiales bacterium]|nr:redoxin family protein [Verrucomicrobiales bacterium]
MKQLFIIAALFVTTSFTLVDAEDNSVAEVWFFVATDCPIANHYAPEINRIFTEYSERGVSFSLIYPDAALTGEEIAEHRREYALKVEGRVDHDHAFVEKAGVTTTPEVAVFDREGSLIYRGMIDDLYSEFGDRRRVASKRYLREVLDQYLSGKSVQFTETDPVGCLIESIK